MEPLQAIPPSPGSAENFFSRPPFICLVPPKWQNVTDFAKIGRRGRNGGRVGVFNHLSVFSE